MRELFDWSGFLAEFSLAADRRGFSSEILLETEDGPLMAWERPGGGPLIYVSAGIHGDEPAGPLAALEMMEAGSFGDDFSWMICPALNPGGLALITRENRRGVDLNRDYLQLQSLETAAHACWLARKPVPDVFVSLHEDWETSGFYFYEINLGPDDPERALAILGAVATIFAPEAGAEIDGHRIREPGWIYHCADPDLPELWPEAIYIAKKGCPLSFTFETPSRAPLGARARAHIAGLEELVKRMAVR